MYSEFHGMFDGDKHLREYFTDYEYKGVFLDIGAGHPITISNSHHFRMNGWKIYSVEANPSLARLYEIEGYNVVNCAVGERNEGFIEFDAYTNSKGWGGNVSSTAAMKGTDYKVIEVPLRTIDDILAHEFKEIESIDIISMDIELSEPQALAGFSFGKYSPTVFLIEDHNPSTSGIEEILDSHGYKLDIRESVDSYYVKKL